MFSVDISHWFTAVYMWLARSNQTPPIDYFMDITEINNATVKSYIVDDSMSKVTTVEDLTVNEAIDMVKNDTIRAVCRRYGFALPDPSDDDASSVAVFPVGTSLLLITCLSER